MAWHTFNFVKRRPEEEEFNESFATEMSPRSLSSCGATTEYTIKEGKGNGIIACRRIAPSKQGECF